MGEMVYAGEEKLIGEVISLTKEFTTIQVYEETSGMKPGEMITGTGATLSVTLAPGILNNIFDGIERPLEEVAGFRVIISAEALPWILWISTKNGIPK